MSHDKVTVDEPLISTDVDHLIRTIAERKRVALNELRSLCRVDKKTMDKWIAVLEDEGYISVEYGLRGTYVNWSLSDAAVPSTAKAAEEAPAEPAQPLPTYSQPPPSEEKTESVETETRTPDRAESDEIRPEPIEPTETSPPEEREEKAGGVKVSEDDSGPEELLSKYLERKMQGEDPDIDNLKSKILTSLKEKKSEDNVDSLVALLKDKDEGAEEKAADTAAPADIEPDLSKLLGKDTAAAKAEATKISRYNAPRYPVGQYKTVQNPPKPEQSSKTAEEEPEEAIEEAKDLRPRIPAAEVRELMNSYMQEISREKAKIDALKKEKETLYREKIAVVDGKMQADVIALTEKILEKQSRITELKEGVLELPDKVDELDKLHKQMDALRSEGREALDRVKVKTDEYVASLEASKERFEAKVDDVRAVLDKQSSKLKELETVRGALETKSSKLKDALDSARAQVDALTASMNALSVDLAQIDQTKDEIASLTDTVKEEVAFHGSELEALEGELEDIAKVERYAQEYVRDYTAKIEDVERYVAKSEDDLLTLREAAEHQYLKKYIGELENLADTYEGELSDAVSREKEIDRKIIESRDRVMQLAQESQSLIKKVRGETSTDAYDYEKVVSRVKAKTSKVGRVLEEKSEERSKLLDESRKSRKTKSSRKVKAKSSKKKRK